MRTSLFLLKYSILLLILLPITITAQSNNSGIDSLYKNAISDFNQKQFDTTLVNKFTKTVNYYKSIKAQDSTIARANNYLGQTSFYLEKYEDAINPLNEAYDYYTKNKGTFLYETQQTLTYIHKSNYSLRNHDLAIKQAKECIQLYMDNDSTDVDIAMSYSNLGNVYMRMGKYNEALKYMLKSNNVEIKEHGADDVALLTNYGNLGNLYGRMGNFEEALSYLNKAITLDKKFPKKKNYRMVTSCYNNMGAVYYYKNDTWKATEYIEKAYSRIKDDLDMSSSRAIFYKNNLGSMYASMGDYKYAMPYFEDVVSTLERTKNDDQLLMAGYLQLAIAEDKYYGNSAKSIDLFLKAKKTLSDSKTPDHPMAMEVHWGLARIYMSQNNLKDAEDELNEALKIYNDKDVQVRLKIGFYASLARINILNNNFDLAKKYLTSGFDLCDSKSCILNSAEHYFNLLSVDLLYKRELYKIDNNPAHLQSILTQVKDIEEIYEELKSGYFETESVRNVVQGFRKVIEEGIWANMQLDNKGKNERILELIEKGKNLIYLEVLHRKEALELSGISPKILKREQTLKQIKIDTENSLSQLKNDLTPNQDSIKRTASLVFESSRIYEKFEDSLRVNFPKYASIRFSQKAFDYRSIVDFCRDDNKFIINYFYGEDNIYVSTISRKGIESHQIKTPKDLKDKIIEFKNSISSIGNKMDVDLSVYLYDLLIGNLGAIQEEKIQILPDDILGYLPFELLCTENNSKNTAIANLSLLIREKQIDYGHTINDIIKTNKHSTHNSILGVRPNFGHNEKKSVQYVMRGGLSPLEGTKNEIAILKDLFDADILEGNVSKNEFIKALNNVSIIHLATHGVIDEQRPNYSKIMFSEIDSLPENESYLNVYELYNMDISANMVVLSACNTAAGKLQLGEGVNCLGRGFLYAGVPNTVMSLWPVEDNSTATIMTNFYENLQKGSTIGSAIRKAKLSYLDQSSNIESNPYFWGSWVYYGNDTAIKMPTKRNVFPYIATVIFFLVICGLWFRNKRKEDLVS